MHSKHSMFGIKLVRICSNTFRNCRKAKSSHLTYWILRMKTLKKLGLGCSCSCLQFMFLYVSAPRDIKYNNCGKFSKPAIEQRKELVICSPFICWLRAALMGAAGENPLIITLPIISVALQAPPAYELLLADRHSIRHRALPQLSAPPASLKSATIYLVYRACGRFLTILV
jgi:hypothetical protein